MNRIGRVFHHPTSLTETFDSLSGHRLAGSHSHRGMAPKKEHCQDFVFRIQPAFRELDEELVDRDQFCGGLALVVKRGILLLVCLL
jgi:hypothetical protein